MKDLRSIEVPLPPIEEQKEISRRLSDSLANIDDIISVSQQSSNIVDDIVESAIIDQIPRTNLPSGWEWKKISEIGDVYSGDTPKRDNDEYFGGDIPWLRLKDAKSFYVDDSEEYITEKGLNNSSAKLLPEGTVIVSTRATIGEVTVSKCPVTTNQGFKAVHPKSAIPEYVAYYMLTITDELENKARTTTYPEVNKTQFSNIEIPIPNQEEQRKIVEEIETIEGRVSNIKEMVKRREDLSRFELINAAERTRCRC